MWFLAAVPIALLLYSLVMEIAYRRAVEADNRAYERRMRIKG